jgi:GNAT superfamily N-acetyltransferase
MDLIRKDSIDDISDLRNEYLDNLCQPQELYSELMMKDATPYLIMLGPLEAGYGLIGDGNILLEFHLKEEIIPQAVEIFKGLIAELKIEKAVCQSFDHLFLSMCMIHSKKRKIVGFNFRDRIEPEPPIRDLKLDVRTATMNDHDLILGNREEIFEDDEVGDIPHYINIGSIKIFEEEGKFAGYGMFNRTLTGRNWFDIGMYVHPEFRKRGYGTYILDRIAQHVTSIGGRPTAGCAFENTGSKKTLEKAGYISNHVMIEFSMID